MTWRPSESPLLRGVVSTGALIAILPELLGVLGMIAPLPMALAWAMILGAALLWHRHRTGRLLPAVSHSIPVHQVHPAWAVTGLFLAITFLVGIASAPNTWDGLSYHLPRVEHWVTQGHLGFWATPGDRQLFMAPWGSYAILQFRLLTGGDQLAFLPSWLTYFGCIILCAQAVRQLGGTDRQAVLGGLIMASVPVAVLHASSVQTDLVTAFWVLCAVVLVIESWQQPDRSGNWRHALCLGLAAGLAVASKATAALALAPWLTLYAIALVRGGGFLALGRPVMMGALAVAVLNGGHFLRNLSLYGSLSGPDWIGRISLVTPWTPARGLANLMANLSLHLGLPWQGWNESLARAVDWTHETVLRVDPATLLPYYDGFRVGGFSAHESHAGMPVLIVGLLLVVISLLVRRRGGGLAQALPLLVAGVAAFTLHAALVLWQPFGSRLQLGSLIWLPVLLPLLLSGRLVQRIAGTIAVVGAIPALLMGTPRSLLGERSVLVTTRSEQLATERPDYFEVVEWTILMAGLSNCRALGILASYDFPEHYLTAVTRREELSLRWRYIGDVGESTRLGPGPGTDGLCMVLVAEPIAGAEPPGLRERFRVVWAEPPFEVLEYVGEPGG